MKKILVSIALIFLMTARFSAAAELPRAQLEESERQFTRAYAYFLHRDYWNAMDYLDRALKANTYLVDYYLLKGLIMNRAGDYEATKSALAYYLEVRPMDPSVPRIFAWFLERQRVLQTLLSPVGVSSRWQVEYPDLQKDLKAGFLRPFSVKGMGKAKMLGSALAISDTFGDQIYFRTNALDDFRRLNAPAPVAALPRGDGIFHVFSASGDVSSFSDLGRDVPISMDVKGTVASTVSDACWVCEDEFVVADPVARSVRFYFAEDLKTPLASWSPSGQAMLFEPVGLSVYAEWLAIADRGNGKVHFLNLVNRRDFFSLSVPMPRDLAWSSLGELFVVSENGEILRFSIDFDKRQAGAPSVLGSRFEGAWALFYSPRGEMFCLDISGSKICKATMLPDKDVNLGVLSLAAPSVALEKDRESFLLEATFSTPFAAYIRSTVPVVHSVWNNRLIPSLPLRQNTPVASDVFVLHRPTRQDAINPSLKAAVVENGKDVQIVLPPIWTLHKNTLTNVVIDSTVLLSREELNKLARFCLFNGLELDVWARNIPSVELIRASALTGGRTLFSLSNAPDLPAPSNKMKIQIPLPTELSSSGYPGRSMLSVHLDVGLIQARDWIPLWPDLLMR